MTITYTITATPEKGTITGYKLEGTSGVEAFRLKSGESALGQIKHNNLLYSFGKGVWGWVDVRKGLLTQTGVVDPPPIDPPPVPDPQQIPYSVQFFISTTGIIDAINITGPGNRAANISYNGVVIAGI